MTEFGSLKTVGGLLPSDLLSRVFAGDPQVPGTAPQTYGLERGESVRRQASRSWLYLLEVWQDFKRRVEGADGEPGAADAGSARVTRERWLHILLRELGFHQVVADGGIELDGRSFPVSHRFGHVPIHLLGWDVDLDHKTPRVTARAPQSMVQELLNRDDAYLWAILSNGGTLRLLRDSASLVGSSYVEFDLEAIFDGELFSDFVLLYLVCHESRLEATGDGGPASCYLEQWRGFAAEQGQRALDQLRDGVQRAIAILGTGFLSHPANPQLRGRLDPRSGDLTLADFNRALLRVVYRLLFWFVAEDRGALLQPDPDDAGASARLREAREWYATYFSSARLRRLARRQRGSRHGDLFDAVQLVFDGLGAEGGVPELALPGTGGIFESWSDDRTPLPLDEPLDGARLSNESLLGAVRALSLVKPRSGGAWRRVDFGNLGAEELGSVYESLLELIPRYDPEQLSYTLETLAGNERKESGSYYTPTPLVDCLLDSALDPLLDEACARGTTQERVAALLDITVCDPACGSGHFLVAAARRIAKRVAAEETGESEPPDAVIRAALRRVAGRCIYGVDINPMAVELAKVSLWLEALEPGKPLSFLDQNIRVGNSLLGVTPTLLAEGLPDAAFAPIEGDDRKVASALKKQNAGEREGQHDLFSQAGIPVTNAVLARRAGVIARALPDSLEDLHVHQQRQAQELAGSAETRVQRLLADAWCAAFVQPKTAANRSTAITHAILERFGAEAGTLDLAAAEELVEGLARQYRFFHWHVEFPHIFRVGNGATGIDPTTGWAGGFSCVIGNPPWERVKLQEKEFFASKDNAMALASKMERGDLLNQLDDTEEGRYLLGQFRAAKKLTDGEAHFYRESGIYPLTASRSINTYAIFSECDRNITSPHGRTGAIVKTGIATDSYTRHFFVELVRTSSLASLYDFENRRKIFPAIDSRERFCLLTMAGRSSPVEKALFAFFLHDIKDLRSGASVYSLSAEEISLLNPNTGTSPVFRARRDAEITLTIYRRTQVLDPGDGGAWGMELARMFHSSDDAGLFEDRLALEVAGVLRSGRAYIQSGKIKLPLYEAKMCSFYDHRAADVAISETALFRPGQPSPITSAEHSNPERYAIPRFVVAQKKVLDDVPAAWTANWLPVWRDVTSGTNERTLIPCILPVAGCTDTLLFCYPLGHPDMGHLLIANLSSFVADYVVRQKIGGTHVKYHHLRQIPVLDARTYADTSAWNGQGTVADWLTIRVLELVYTAYDIEEFARGLGDDGPPFRWNDERRVVIRAELDAAYFHLYCIERDDVDYIMETFPIVKRKDVERYGSFRTKDLILERYDAMAEAIRTGVPYQTIIDPPPGHGLRHPDRAETTRFGADGG